MAVCHVERPGECSVSPRHRGIMTSTSCAHQSFFSVTFLDNDTFCTPRRYSLLSFFLLPYQHRITPTRLCSNLCVMNQTMHGEALCPRLCKRLGRDAVAAPGKVRHLWIPSQDNGLQQSCTHPQGS